MSGVPPLTGQIQSRREQAHLLLAQMCDDSVRLERILVQGPTDHWQSAKLTILRNTLLSLSGIVEKKEPNL